MSAILIKQSFHNIIILGVVVLPRFSLTPYEIRVKKIDSKEYLKFGDVKGKDFSEILEKKLQSLRKSKLLKDSNKTISVHPVKRNLSIVSGIIHSGEYGLDADFVDTETMQTLQKMRQQKHSEVYPFFFLFDLPKTKDYGYAILQEFRGRGVKSILSFSINKLFRRLKLQVSMKPIFSPKLLEMLENSRLVSLRFIRRKVPKDIADLVHEDKAEEIIEERVIRARPNERIKITKDFKRILKEAISDASEGYYVILDEDYDMVKAQIERGDSRKTLTFGSEHKLRESMPLEKKLVLVGGFPTYEYLLKEAKKYLTEIKSEGLRG